MRGQTPEGNGAYAAPTYNGSPFGNPGNSPRYPQPPASGTTAAFQPPPGAAFGNPNAQPAPRADEQPPVANGQPNAVIGANNQQPYVRPSNQFPLGSDIGLPPNFADIEAIVEEARTGRLVIGAGINSDAGVTGQLVIDERNFDITALPRSWEDFANGRAFRGNGQAFRLEAMPGVQLQRYLVSFTEPYFWYGMYSLNLSGFYFDRNFFDWTEQRAGGRLALGYRITHDLSVSLGGRYENVKIRDPRVGPGVVPELDEVLGRNDLAGVQLTLTHDTRDVPFAPTEGHLIELSYEQVFGTFDYPRGEVDYRKYFLVRERVDGSGRHTFSTSLRAGFSGSQTPIFENFFAGGFSTLRGFDFRGASPIKSGIRVGGEFRLLGSVEYMFPLTADDMIKGVFFCDYGTVEEKIEIKNENFRVAPGFGVRLFIPAMGPAPLAFDFAFPVADAAGDDRRIFSFFIGYLR